MKEDMDTKGEGGEGMTFSAAMIAIAEDPGCRVRRRDWCEASPGRVVYWVPGGKHDGLREKDLWDGMLSLAYMPSTEDSGATDWEVFEE